MRINTLKRSSEYRPYPVLLDCCKSVDRMIEALVDPKTWLFALFMALNTTPASLSNQLQIIIVSFGFGPLHTTLLTCATGAVFITAVFTSVTIASRIPNSIALVGIMFYIPSILGVFLVNFLPWHDKVGMLFAVLIASAHLVSRSRRSI